MCMYMQERVQNDIGTRWCWGMNDSFPWWKIFKRNNDVVQNHWLEVNVEGKGEKDNLILETVENCKNIHLCFYGAFRAPNKSFSFLITLLHRPFCVGNSGIDQRITLKPNFFLASGFSLRFLDRHGSGKGEENIRRWQLEELWTGSRVFSEISRLGFGTSDGEAYEAMWQGKHEDGNVKTWRNIQRAGTFSLLAFLGIWFLKDNLLFSTAINRCEDNLAS